MNRFEKYIFFPYSWHIDDKNSKDSDKTIIRIYGLNNNNENVCVRIDDFTPFCFLELPTYIEWTEDLAILLHNKIIEKLVIYKPYVPNKPKEILYDYRPITYSLHFKKKLYYAYFDSNGNRKKYPFLFLAFQTKECIKQLSFKIKNGIFLPGQGKISVKIHENNADEILQLISRQNIYTSDWIEFIGKRINDDKKITYCQHEFICSYKKLKNHVSNSVPNPLILCFDIETNSSIPTAFPSYERKDDKIFQISCILLRQGNDEKYMDKYLLSLGHPEHEIVGKDTTIYMFDTEWQLLEGFKDFINEKNPNIITGFNIFGFDINYMLERSKFPCSCYETFTKMGFLIDVSANIKNISWSSSAYGSQDFEYIDAEGRLFIDLLPIIKRNYKLDTYSLKSVSNYFIGDTKDDLTPQGIFKCYKLGMELDSNNEFTKKARKAMGLVGSYCIKDSVLVLKLFEKLQIWIDLVEMAKVTNVPIVVLYTQGQQIKVFSQVYKNCMYENYVVERDGYKVGENEHYTGAHVFDPIVGIHEKVIPYDFSSLYPSTMIANNICWSTLVNDRWIIDSSGNKVWKKDENIKDEDCNVIEWWDHIGCEHDTKVYVTRPKHIMCDERKYRFIKHPIGILPKLLKNLLQARSDTKDKLRDIKKQLKSKDFSDSEKKDLSILATILDKRQLALKVSANSAYGALGVQKGMLPLMPGAMCTTAKGREYLLKTADILQSQYNCKLVYGDSVTEDTPVLCKINDKLYYKTIDEISQNNWINYHDTKEESKPINNIEIWTEQGFTKIKRVIRHKTTKEIFRVLTHTGVVDSTEDHGLLDINKNKISPNEIINKLNNSEKIDLLYSKLPIRDYSLSDNCSLNKGKAFVLGFFYADGSCGYYKCKSGDKYSWALNNLNLDFLKKSKIILESIYTNIEFNILDTVKISNVYKLVPKGKNIKELVIEWRKMLYDKRKYKKVPDEILWANKDIQEEFLEGYYCGDGDKDYNGYIRFDNKGKIGAAGLYFLSNQLGYNVSINTRNDKPDIYRLTLTKSKQRKIPNRVKKIYSLGKTEKYVYDIETENHHFSAGIGELIVHNTDSNYVIFPHLKDKSAKEIWEHSERVAEEVSKYFPEPVSLAFEEKIYWSFLILAKKKYMCLSSDKEGNISKKVEKRGCVLVRRDTCKFIQETYEKFLHMIFNSINEEIIKNELDKIIESLFNNEIDVSKFIITKSVKSTNNLEISNITKENCLDKRGNIKKDKLGNIKTRTTCTIGAYKVNVLDKSDKNKEKKQLLDKKATNEQEFYLRSLPAHIQLAEKMKRRGKPVASGTRLEYVILWDETLRSILKDKIWEKIESAEYFIEHKDILKLDYMYYLECLYSSLDEILNVVFKEKDYIYNIYKNKLEKIKYQETLRPKIKFI